MSIFLPMLGVVVTILAGWAMIRRYQTHIVLLLSGLILAAAAAFLAGGSTEHCCKYASRVAAYKCANRGLRGLKFDAESINACEREGE